MSHAGLVPVRTALPAFLMALFFCSLNGCTSLPHLDKQLGQPHSPGRVEPGSLQHPPTINDLILKLQCEIAGYSRLKEQQKLENPLKKYAYVVTANLSADAKIDGGLSPSLNFINPLSTPGTNFTNAIAGQWDGTQHKTFTQQFSLDLSREVKGDSGPGGCSTIELGGSFGIGEILNAGLDYGPETKNLMYEMPADICPTGSKIRPVFGGTIDFAIMLSASGGPTWTVTHFKGPTGGSPWIGYTRKETNTLTVSFAPSELGDILQCQGVRKSKEQLAQLESEMESFRKTLRSSQDTIDNARFRLRNYSKSAAERSALTSSLKDAELRKSIAENSLAKAQSTKEAINEELSRNRSFEKQDAARAAQENNTQMILQNLLLNTH
jgi:hypothetical protein